jgi:hypothetical protein
MIKINGAKIMQFLKRVKDKYNIMAVLTDKEINNLPDDAWNMLATWLYHSKLVGDIELTLDEGKDPDDFFNKSELSDLKAKFGTSDPNTALEKASAFHTKRVKEIQEDIKKKYPQVDDIDDLVHETYVFDKLNKWADPILRLGYEPSKKYIN